MILVCVPRNFSLCVVVPGFRSVVSSAFFLLDVNTQHPVFCCNAFLLRVPQNARQTYHTGCWRLGAICGLAASSLMGTNARKGSSRPASHPASYSLLRSLRIRRVLLPPTQISLSPAPFFSHLEKPVILMRSLPARESLAPAQPAATGATHIQEVGC